jgi:hypothetical protein
VQLGEVGASHAIREARAKVAHKVTGEQGLIALPRAFLGLRVALEVDLYQALHAAGRALGIGHALRILPLADLLNCHYGWSRTREHWSRSRTF